jgi:dipeptidyl aminopeptidase/acylaminoacyl peptidase
VPWPAVRYVGFPSRADGKPVRAKLLLPPGYGDAPGRSWPAVVYVHGAGIATSVLKQWGSYNELRYVFNSFLANHGYLVLDLDYRGSTGYGREWRSDVYLHLGGKDLGDVLGAVDFLKKEGTVDLKRLGIWGVSYGGFMTNMALFQAPGVFRAGSSWASVNDWENYNAGYTSQRLNTPATHREAYRRSSPIWFSNNLQDRLLIVHGMVDNNVLFQDAVQLTEKLLHEGKGELFSHIYYPEESHGFIRDETWVDASRRTFDWFQRYLAAE